MNSQGASVIVRNRFAPIYEWFAESFETPDLKSAKALFNELS
jgi:hypothetical protein